MGSTEGFRREQTHWLRACGSGNGCHTNQLNSKSLPFYPKGSASLPESEIGVSVFTSIYKVGFLSSLRCYKVLSIVSLKEKKKRKKETEKVQSQNKKQILATYFSKDRTMCRVDFSDYEELLFILNVQHYIAICAVAKEQSTRCGEIQTFLEIVQPYSRAVQSAVAEHVRVPHTHTSPIPE